MIIHVFGEDSYRVFLKTRQLREHFCSKFDPQKNAVHVFYEKPDRAEISAIVRSGGLFSEKKLLIFHELLNQLKAEESGWFAEILRGLTSDTIIILQDTLSIEDCKKKPLWKQCGSMQDRHEYPFPAFSVSEAAKWILQEAKGSRVSLSQQDAAYLVNRCGTDSWRLHNELTKLSAVSGSGAVTKEMIDLIVEPLEEERVFPFVDAVVGASKAAVELLYKEQKAGADDYSLFNLLQKQTRNIVGAAAAQKDGSAVTKAELSSEYKIHPFVAEKSLNLAKKRSFSFWKKIHSSLFSLDVDSKTGRRRHEGVLEDVVLLHKKDPSL